MDGWMDAVDCGHVAKRALSEDGFFHMNHKIVHMIKLEVICDTKYGSTKFSGTVVNK